MLDTNDLSDVYFNHMDCHCPDCPPSQSLQNTCLNSLDQDPHNAYNNAFYHYQAYLYYWNLYNAHFGHTRDSEVSCECYGDVRQEYYGVEDTVIRGSYRFLPAVISKSRYQHCPDQGSSHFTGSLKPNETQLYYQSESYGMEVEEDQSHDDGGDDDDDGDEQRFELDERFYQFLRKSEKHRKEREKEKRANAKLDEYVEAGKLHINASSLPPQEQQGAKRKEAMKALYGDKAAYIMSLEASLQLHYDRNFDTRQPKFWPNIPLKF